MHNFDYNIFLLNVSKCRYISVNIINLLLEHVFLFDLCEYNKNHKCNVNIIECTNNSKRIVIRILVANIP